MNCLVIAPHCDDEVIGCAGTIAKYAERGHSVYVAILTNANMGAPELFTAESIRTVRAESIKAHKTIGVNETFFYNFPAPSLDQFPSYKISLTINSLLEKLQPQVLFIPSNSDLHLDHSVIHRCCIVSARSSKRTCVKKILAYEVMSETDLFSSTIGDIFAPNYYIDITQQIEQKKNALESYESQLYGYPTSRSLNAILSLACVRGGAINVEYAEAFQVVKIIDDE